MMKTWVLVGVSALGLASAAQAAQVTSATIEVGKTACKSFTKECDEAIERVCTEASQAAYARARQFQQGEKAFDLKSLALKTQVRHSAKRRCGKDDWGTQACWMEYTQTCLLTAELRSDAYKIEPFDWKLNFRGGWCDWAMDAKREDMAILHQNLHQHVARNRLDKPSYCSGEEIRISPMSEN